jgi:hydrogenase nickel incorporation protein HypA/HybF
MHEASASEAIVKMVAEEALARGRAEGQAFRVTRIKLVIGEATGYMRESLEFYVSASAKGTPVEGAILELRYVKPLLRCPACGLEYERKRFTFDCPSCGAQGRMSGSGSEFYVDSIEIEPTGISAPTGGPASIGGEG